MADEVAVGPIEYVLVPARDDVRLGVARGAPAGLQLGVRRVEPASAVRAQCRSTVGQASEDERESLYKIKELVFLLGESVLRKQMYFL